MFKRAALAVIILILPVAMAFPSIYSEASSYDPMSAVSYYGSFYDVFANPAALPCVETETGNLSLSFLFSDDWDINEMKRESMPLLQQQDWDIRASFIARNISLSAFFGTEFARSSSDPVYDIYSTLRIQLDVAYAFPHISFGARVSGGNRMIRTERTVDSFTDIFANAWFSPFKRDAGSEFFNLGAGALFYYSVFSAGVYVGELMTLSSDGGDIYMGWDAISRSTTLSLALSAPRFLRSDDLRFFRPRASFSVTDLSGSGSTVVWAAELRLQFLPDADLSFALSYTETEHKFFQYRPENGYVSFFVKGGASGFTGTLGVIINAADGARISPVIGFSYIS